MVGMMSRMSLRATKPLHIRPATSGSFHSLAMQTSRRFFQSQKGPFSQSSSVKLNNTSMSSTNGAPSASRRGHQQYDGRSWSSMAASSSGTSIMNSDSDEDYRLNPHNRHHTVDNPFFLQVRWKRNDGNKASTRQRPPTKKQRKEYGRKMQARHGQQDRHGQPGSKAGPRREWAQETKREMLASRRDLQPVVADDEYDIDDALLDDLIGNTKHLASQPTPKPVYLGHRERQYYNRVADQLERYRLRMDASTEQDKHAIVDLSDAELPSDRDVSLALRAFRDRQGTRQKPVGIVAALQLLLQDLGVPLSAFDEKTYTTLLTCCRSPAEGRRILQMMDQQKQPVTVYSWSILIDIHSKIGDFDGCCKVLDEMVAAGVAPGLPAYTSLLAACYKVCNDGRISRSVRVEAGEVGWRKWQELRIVGVEPDAMAYGAMLRLCAARGEPEKALGLLEEMEQLQVKPTTLCFSSALRAVARSHSTAIRYENGSSKKNRRREFLTNHHGKIARTLVIMAENTEVDQDRGFVSALISCSAAAGDIATAKAIYVASQVRRLDQLRTVGPNSHLARLSGQSAPMDYIPGDMGSRSLLAGGDGMESSEMALSNDGSPLVETQGKRRRRYPSFGQREYGKDTRSLSAILHACAKAVDKNGIGTMWQGRENRGYLDEDSLRLMTAHRVPNYHDNSIPGLDGRQIAMSSMTWDGEDRELDFRGDKRNPRKFDGLEDDEDAGTTLDDIDEMFSRMYVNEDGQLKKEYRKSTPEDIWRAKYPKDHDLDEDMALPSAEPDVLLPGGKEQPPEQLSTPKESEEMYFDFDTMKWQTRAKSKEQLTPEVVSSLQNSSVQETPVSNEEEMYFDEGTLKWSTRTRLADSELKQPVTVKNAGVEATASDGAGANGSDEMYFDTDEMRWKTRSSAEAEKAKRTEYEDKLLASDEMQNRNDAEEEPTPSGADLSAPIDDEAEFVKFYNELKEELASSVDGLEGVNEEEARELFLAMKDEYKEVLAMDFDDLDLKDLSSLGGIDLESFKDVGIDDDGDPSSLSAPAETDGVNALGAIEELPIDEEELADKDFDTFFDELQDEWKEQGVDLGGGDSSVPERAPQSSPAVGASSSGTHVSLSGKSAPEEAKSPATGEFVQVLETAPAWSQNELPGTLAMQQGSTFTETIEVLDDAELDLRESQLVYLREVLPAFSENRLVKIQNTFNKSLGDPSILELIPIVRERMPDYVTATWLKQMGSLTARFVMHTASQENLVDVHMLNGVLELDASAGSLDRALEFHQTQFQSHGLAPTGYSDRLVLQMFVKNNRLQRALVFKQAVEGAGRTLDLQSYGSLIDYCGRHNQLGSGLLLVKECVAAHGAPPGEASLSQLRILCRQARLTDEIGLTSLIGPDPVEWLRHGEANLKREYSKKGRRGVQFARNVLLQI